MHQLIDTAVLGGGCFWQIEDAYRGQIGINNTCVGYMGGDFENPCHLDVCARITGHAEVVMISFDPQITIYERLLELFWEIHDPTTLNRQGPDRGEQYRSIIFYNSPDQRRLAEQSKYLTQAQFEQSIVTEIKAVKTFWPAKEEHQQYLFKKRSR